MAREHTTVLPGLLHTLLHLRIGGWEAERWRGWTVESRLGGRPVERASSCGPWHVAPYAIMWCSYTSA